MADKPTIAELRKIIKDEGLKIAVKNDADVDEVLKKIEEKRAKLTEKQSSEKEVEKSTSSEDDKPKCYGKFVKTGDPKCRRCWFAQTCKKM